ncbi:MAG TPA: hypothetical protein VFR24_05190 [Candidatus Angelobacter sp.]|nr:hypothetical protein [Candidatus Angelobacter sp.]
MGRPIIVNPLTPLIENEIASRVLKRLRERFDTSCALGTLDCATGGEIYVYGGVLRRSLFSDSHCGDLDLMVRNGDDRAFETLNILRVPFGFNRSGHHRYRWNNLQIDVLQPREFYGGFEDIESFLSFFDLKINALALHMGSQRIIDPFKVLVQENLIDPGINWQRWDKMPTFELVILAIRLLKIMHEIPSLRIPLADTVRLQEDVVPKIRDCEWTNLYNRFPKGKEAFLRMFSETVLKHQKSLTLKFEPPA